MPDDVKYVSISVKYRFADGYHIFTSEDIRGLYVASREPRKAYDGVVEVLQDLVTRQSEGATVEIIPSMTFEEWVTRRRDATADRQPALRSRDIVIRLAA